MHGASGFPPGRVASPAWSADGPIARTARHRAAERRARTPASMPRLSLPSTAFAGYPHEIREVDAHLHADHHPADVDQDLAPSMAICCANSRRVKPNAVRSTRSPAKSVITASPDVSSNTNRSTPAGQAVQPGSSVQRVVAPSAPERVRTAAARDLVIAACQRSGSPRCRRRACRRYPIRPDHDLDGLNPVPSRTGSRIAETHRRAGTGHRVRSGSPSMRSGPPTAAAPTSSPASPNRSSVPGLRTGCRHPPRRKACPKRRRRRPGRPRAGPVSPLLSVAHLGRGEGGGLHGCAVEQVQRSLRARSTVPCPHPSSCAISRMLIPRACSSRAFAFRVRRASGDARRRRRRRPALSR